MFMKISPKMRGPTGIARSPNGTVQVPDMLGALLQLCGTAAGAANVSYISFCDILGVRQGYVGDYAVGNSDIALGADVGGVSLLTGGSVRLNINSTGNATLNAPTSGVPLTVLGPASGDTLSLGGNFGQMSIGATGALPLLLSGGNTSARIAVGSVLDIYDTTVGTQIAQFVTGARSLQVLPRNTNADGPAIKAPSALFSGKQSTAASAAINTTDTYITPAFNVVGVFVAAGTKIRISAYGTCTSTVANLSTFTVRAGTGGSTADASMGTLTCTAAAAGTTIPFYVEFDVTFRAAGAGGSIIVAGRLINNGATGITSAATGNVVAIGAATASNTTGTPYAVGLSYKSAAATTTCTFQSVNVCQIM